MKKYGAVSLRKRNIIINKTYLGCRRSSYEPAEPIDQQPYELDEIWQETGGFRQAVDVHFGRRAEVEERNQKSTVDKKKTTKRLLFSTFYSLDHLTEPDTFLEINSRHALPFRRAHRGVFKGSLGLGPAPR